MILASDSPLRNIPAALYKNQAIFIDGIRQNAQIAIYAYNRLCQSLTTLAHQKLSNKDIDHDFTHVFLDIWTCVEALDRFRQLWQAQPAADTIPQGYNSAALNVKLQPIRKLRNISSHIAQRIDHIASLNASVSGTVHWLTVMNHEPLEIYTLFIRPSILHGGLKTELITPKGKIQFTHDTANIVLSAGEHRGNISDAYEFICSVLEFADAHLRSKFAASKFTQRLPSNMFGSAKLDI